MSIEIAKKRILERVDLAELIRERLELKKRAGRYVGLCPFHAEKSPSFTIFDHHYFCFGCQARGDAIDFVRQDQGLGFIEALKYLAEKFRVEVPELEQGIKDDGERKQLANLYQILQVSRDFFQTQLASPEGESCRLYLQNRGFSEERIKEYQFGFAPDRPNELVNYLLKRGFSLQDLIAASVATLSERDRRAYDFYRNRLMIPIRDHYGRIIAFGGRALGDDPAKYKNSRETVLFDKSRVLYGFDWAKDAIRQSRRAIVVEGYMDALQLRNYAFPETVACLGTALTVHHVKRLSQLANELILVFDGDEAGKRASLKTIEIAMAHPQARFRVLRLPNREDPDSYLRRHGSESFQSLTQEAQDLMEYAIHELIGDAHETAIPELVNREFVPWLRSIADPIQQSYLANQIAKHTGIQQNDILSLVRTRDGSAANGSLHTPKVQQKVLATIPQAREPIPIEKKIEDRPPRPDEYALIGHLYFAQPEELNLDRVLDLLKTNLKLPKLWQDLAFEMIQSLKKSQSPCEIGPYHWKTGISDLVLKVLEEIDQQKKSAFQCENRMARIEQIVEIQSREAIRQTIQSLKKSLADASPQDQIDILKSIQKLTRENSVQSM